jgi:hypothetical protein
MILASSTKHKREGEDQNTQGKRGTQRKKKKARNAEPQKMRGRKGNNREL